MEASSESEGGRRMGGGLWKKLSDSEDDFPFWMKLPEEGMSVSSRNWTAWWRVRTGLGGAGCSRSKEASSAERRLRVPKFWLFFGIPEKGTFCKSCEET